MLTIKPLRSKKFGQHFLHDKAILQKIIQMTAIASTDCFIEIGPGGGALTEYLLPLVHDLIAIEIDRDLYASLQERWGHLKERFHLYLEDALKVDFNTLTYPSGCRIRLIGNLAYNIATPLLFHLLQYTHIIHDLHVMLQKEVANRLIAAVNTPEYGRLSVMIQYFCQVKRLLIIRPGAFYPAPKVDSAMVRLQPWQARPFQAHDEKLFAEVVKQAFSQRRKTIGNSLKKLGIQRTQLEQWGINSKYRAEQLGVSDYVHIANTLSALG